MKCFNHNDRDAFGVDVITGKGLCLECLEEHKGLIIEKNNQVSKLGAQYWARLYNFASQEKLLKIFSFIMLTSAILYFMLGAYEFFVKKDVNSLANLIFAGAMFGAFLLTFVLGKIFKKVNK